MNVFPVFTTAYNKLSYNTSFSPAGCGNAVSLWVSLCLFSSLGTLNPEKCGDFPKVPSYMGRSKGSLCHARLTSVELMLLFFLLFSVLFPTLGDN